MNYIPRNEFSFHYRGRYCFQFVCQSTPRPGGGGQVRMGGYPSQVWMGEVPNPRCGRGRYPLPGLDGGGGVPHPVLDGGVQDWMGYPHPNHYWMGYPPPVQDWKGYPSPPPVGRQSTIASTCYAAGGMRLAFTQEDFLVIAAINVLCVF